MRIQVIVDEDCEMLAQNFILENLTTGASYSKERWGKRTVKFEILNSDTRLLYRLQLTPYMQVTHD